MVYYGFMVKVTAPMLSLRASGTIGNAITFVCGQFAKRHEGSAGSGQKGNPVQMAKFSAGAAMWKSFSTGIKNLWNDFYKTLLSSGKCVSVTYDLSGYDMFMLYWLKFGDHGWPDYPNPGPEPK
jgi:hypothetical protein